jgi:hypothetical protein
MRARAGSGHDTTANGFTLVTGMENADGLITITAGIATGIGISIAPLVGNESV